MATLYCLHNVNFRTHTFKNAANFRARSCTIRMCINSIKKAESKARQGRTPTLTLEKTNLGRNPPPPGARPAPCGGTVGRLWTALGMRSFFFFFGRPHQCCAGGSHTKMVYGCIEKCMVKYRRLWVPMSTHKMGYSGLLKFVCTAG